jgi:hypothetical protein
MLRQKLKLKMMMELPGLLQKLVQLAYVQETLRVVYPF